MCKLLTNLAVAALLVTARVSHGAVVATFIDRGVPTNGTTPAVGYHAFVFHLHSDTGNVTAVDFSGSHGFYGSLAQRWVSSNTDGNYDSPTPGFSTSQNLTNSAANYDSHFLGVSANYVVGAALTEDAIIPPSGSAQPGFPTNTANAGIGAGTFLKGAYGVVAANQTLDFDVAYLVVADHSFNPFVGPFLYGAEVATANGTFQISNPEPASVSVLGVCLVGGCVRRRRKRNSLK